MGLLAQGRIEHSVPITGSHYPGVRSATYTEKAWGMARYLTCTAGANKVLNVCTKPLVWLHTDGTPPSPYARDWEFAMMVNPQNVLTTPTGECLQGIQLGAFDAFTPYQTNYASDVTGGGVIQLRYNFALSRFELCIWDADNGLAPEIVPTTFNPTFSADLNAKLMRLVLKWNNGAPYVQCWLDSTMALQHSSTRLTNFCNGSPAYGPGYFVTSGSNALWQILEAGFHENYYVVDLYA